MPALPTSPPQPWKVRPQDPQGFLPNAPPPPASPSPTSPHSHPRNAPLDVCPLRDLQATPLLRWTPLCSGAVLPSRSLPQAGPAGAPPQDSGQGHRHSTPRPEEARTWKGPREARVRGSDWTPHGMTEPGAAGSRLREGPQDRGSPLAPPARRDLSGRTSAQAGVGPRGPLSSTAN